MAIVINILMNLNIIFSLVPDQNEPFIALSIISNQGTAQDYFPNNDNRISLESVVSWEIFVQNKMPTPQYISIKFKIINSPSLFPNSTTLTPSSEPSIYEENILLLSDQSLKLPFNWTITQFEQLNNSQEKINAIKINEEIHQISIIGRINDNYHIIFELWTFDVNQNQFIFSWNYEEQSRCVWNHIPFSVQGDT